MSRCIAVAKDGTQFEFVINEDPPSGAMKYVYFTPQKDHVVAFFKKTPDPIAMERLESLVGKYQSDIFESEGGTFFRSVFCWPEKIVECDVDGEHRVGITMPTYPKHFFFQFDKNHIGGEKEGKWFASAKLFRRLDEREKGNFLNYIRICLKLARAIRRLHMAGLAHSDLSYKNVLIDPSEGNVCVIDVDSLVVPGKYAPDVIGTPDFIAPEVLCDNSFPKKALPCQNTDKHALAVLIYMYLLHRHPLRGGKFYPEANGDSDEEEKLLMGSKPVYIEHPTDKSNRNMKREYDDDLNACMPWVDLKNFSAQKIAGPFLAKLFERAFVDGVKDPSKRPLAEEWEKALMKTADRILPCSNKMCSAKWFVFDNSKDPICPFCNTPYKGIVPKLEFYTYNQVKKSYVPEDYQLTVFPNQGLYKWHVNKMVVNNEKLPDCEKMRQGYFIFHNKKWMLVNERLTSLYEIQNGTKIQKKPGEFIELKDGSQILLSSEKPGGRLCVVQLAGKLSQSV